MGIPMSSRPGFWSRRCGRASPEAALVLAVVTQSPLAAQATRAERTDFNETSSYADVLMFLDSLQHRTGDIRIGTLGTSPEGRRVPYVLAARPLVASPAEAHRSSKL